MREREWPLWTKSWEVYAAQVYLSVWVWSKSYLVGNTQEFCGALGGTAPCAVVIVEAIISEHHYLHEEGPPVRQRRPMQVSTLDLPEGLMLKAEKHFGSQHSQGTLTL